MTEMTTRVLLIDVVLMRLPPFADPYASGLSSSCCGLNETLGCGLQIRIGFNGFY
jgi:hypothetical protein